MLVGHINYLNCLPLTYTFSQCQEHDFKIIRDVPAKLNDDIINDKLDISPVSSIIYARNWKKLMILPDVSIMSDGDVQSIILVSKKPIEDITNDKILLTSQSATSHCLLKIIMNKLYHASPNYEIKTVTPQNIFPDKEGTATLFIGDDALYEKYHKQKNLYYYDLGREWKKLTGLCMVYAVWVVRRKYAKENPDKVRKVQHYIHEGFTNGFINRQKAIAELTADKPFTPKQLDEYLHVIKWKLQEEQLVALSQFYRYAYELNLIENIPELDIFY